MKLRTANRMLMAFRDICKYLRDKNFTPKLHVMDNECFKIVKNFIQNEQNTKLQFVEAHQHRVSAAER